MVQPISPNTAQYTFPLLHQKQQLFLPREFLPLTALLDSVSLLAHRLLHTAGLLDAALMVMLLLQGSGHPEALLVRPSCWVP